MPTKDRQIHDKITGVSAEVTDNRELSVRLGSDMLNPETYAVKTIDYQHHEIHRGSAYYLEGHIQLEDGPGIYRVNLTTPAGTKYGHFTWTITSNGITEITHYEGPAGAMGNGSRGTIHANNRTKNCWSGIHTTGASAAALVDSSEPWIAGELEGMQVFNQTDGSSGFITANTIDTVTATLAGGTDNDWDVNDVYEINNSQMIINVGVDAPTTYGLELAGTKFGGTGFKADVGGGTDRAHEIITKPSETYMFVVTSSSTANIITFSISWYEHTDK